MGADLKISQVTLGSQYHDTTTFHCRDIEGAFKYIDEHTRRTGSRWEHGTFLPACAEEFKAALREFWELGGGTRRTGMNKYRVDIEELGVW